MVSHRDEYLRFLSDLPDVKKRDTKTQVVFSVNRQNFCWIWKKGDKIQIFPSLGSRATGKRYLTSKDGKTLILNRKTGEIDAKYLDPGEKLEWVWSYPGFSIGEIQFEEGCDLIKQAYDQAKRWKKGGVGPGHGFGPEKESFKVIEIKDGERGITYESLFGEYISGASWIKIKDPYIRKDHQIRNVEEVLNIASFNEKCRVELVTMFETRSQLGEKLSKQRLEALKKKLADRGIDFSYTFDPKGHERFIETEKWKISIGRGLDIFYPNNRARECCVFFIPK